MSIKGKYADWKKKCPLCDADLTYEGEFTRLIHVVDPDKDCVTEFKCPECEQSWPRSIGEVIALQETPKVEEPTR